MPFTALRRTGISPAFTGPQGQIIGAMPYADTTQVHLRIRGGAFWEQDGFAASMWSDGPVNLVRQPIDADGSRERLVAISVGRKAERLDQLAPEERGEFVIAEIERLRPSTRGKLEVTGVWSWKQAPFIGGCRHSWRPGQVSRFAEAMIEPHERLHFAGEHTRRIEIGMESAMESGERAAFEILTAGGQRGSDTADGNNLE